MDSKNERIVWIDCEMTRLDLERDALIEVAALVTDSDLTILGDGVDVVIACDELAAGVTMAQAQDMVMTYVREWVPDPRKAPLAGNTVGTDRGFLARDMPELDQHLHYRIIDVSSIKELSRRWFPRAYYSAPKKGGGHRALADIRESIEELKYYRQAVFVPAPGPDSASARRIAASLAAPPNAP